MNDPRRRVPGTDGLLADPRLVEAQRVLGRTLVKSVIADAQQRARAGQIDPERVADHATRLSALTGRPPIAYTSDSALVAAIRPQSYASSTTGVKKSVVAISAVPPSMRTTAASSPLSSPTSSSPTGWRGAADPNPRTTSSSSPGGILHAQPPPRAY